MADEEIGARLRLRDRREFSEDAERAARDVRGIGDQADKADGAGRRMGGGMGIASKGIGGLVSVAKVGAVAVGALAGGLALADVKVVGLAMDAAETESKFNTVFAGMEQEVGAFVSTMNADYGIPKKDLQDAVSGFGIFAKAVGVPKDALADFSTDLTTAGTDLASFYNADTGEVFDALKSGLAGEAEPLKKFVIFLTEATMKAEAATMGLTGELTEGQKVMVRQSIILKSLGDAQGDMARTSGGLANQFKGLKGRLTGAGTAIGTALIPYATWLVEVLNARLQPAVEWLQNNLPDMVNSSASAIGDAYQRVAGAWEGGASYGETLQALTGLDSVVEPANRVADALGDVWTIVRDGIVPAFQTVSSNLPGVVQPLNVLDATLDYVADNATTLHPLIVLLVGGFVLWRAAVIAHTAVMAVSGFLMAARVGITMLLTGATGLNTAAELTRNQALVASIALHARLGAMLVWMGVKAVASMVLSVATTVGGWILMGATAMASGLVMAAAWIIGLGPIGWAIGLLILMGAAFVVLWKKSETFRNIVTGAMGGVKNAAISAKDWIVSSFNTVVSFFSGLPGRISSATSGLFNGIRTAFRSAVNFIIDGWNNLSFSIPSIDTRIPGIGRVGGMSIGTPNIPRLHTGGTTVTGGSAIIQPDEELVILPPAASVVPLDNRPAITAATGGQSGPITLQVVLDRRVIAEAVYEYTGDQMARR